MPDLRPRSQPYPSRDTVPRQPDGSVPIVNTDQVHLCFECGAKNRIPRGKEAAAKCGRCGQPMYPNLYPASATPLQTVEPTPSPTPHSARSISGRRRGAWFPAIAAVLLLGVPAYNYLDSRGLLDFQIAQPWRSVQTPQGNSSWRDAPIVSPSDATVDRFTPEQREIIRRAQARLDAKQGQPDSAGALPQLAPAPVPRPAALVGAPEPVAIRPGIVWNRTGRAGAAPFEVVTQPGANYFLKLVDADTGADQVAIYAIGGRRLEVSVPTGRYKLKYAAGQTWYGEKIFFGPEENTLFSASPTTFQFKRTGTGYEGYTVELIIQQGGNMSTRRIPREQF